MLCLLFFGYSIDILFGLNRRANFTSADMRECDFSGSTFNGAYLEKAVAYKTNFTGRRPFLRFQAIVHFNIK